MVIELEELAKPGIKVKVKKLHANARLPTYGSVGAACFDLYALEDTRSIFGRAIVSTGISVEIPPGYEMVVRPRSWLAFKSGIHAFAGTIDSDYRGEVKVLLVTDSSSSGFEIRKGERIAQASIQPVLRVEFNEVSELGDTDRGAGGFGSTGQ